MNQDKSGKFIAKLRKEKKMTQQELAEKMGISINAVSKWERGLSFPDVSLYKKLCNELGINIEELINGEKDNSEEAKEKAIISTVKENEKIKKKSKKILVTILIIFVIIISCLIYYNKKLKVNLVDDSDYLYEEIINFLKEKEFSDNPDSNNKDLMCFIVITDLELKKILITKMCICGYIIQAIILKVKSMDLDLQFHQEVLCQLK